MVGKRSLAAERRHSLAQRVVSAGKAKVEQTDSVSADGTGQISLVAKSALRGGDCGGLGTADFSA